MLTEAKEPNWTASLDAFDFQDFAFCRRDELKFYGSGPRDGAG